MYMCVYTHIVCSVYSSSLCLNPEREIQRPLPPTPRRKSDDLQCVLAWLLHTVFGHASYGRRRSDTRTSISEALQIKLAQRSPSPCLPAALRHTNLYPEPQ